MSRYARKTYKECMGLRGLAFKVLAYSSKMAAKTVTSTSGHSFWRVLHSPTVWDFPLVVYLRMRPMDLMALVGFLHVSFMWYVRDRLLSKLTSKSQTLSGSWMMVLAKESFSLFSVLMKQGVNSITSVFSTLLLSMFGVFHHITSSI